MSESALDERWDWIEERTLGEADPRYIRGACRHLDLIPVENVDGERVAMLCRTCDMQLPA